MNNRRARVRAFPSKKLFIIYQKPFVDGARYHQTIVASEARSFNQIDARPYVHRAAEGAVHQLPHAHAILHNHTTGA